MSIKSDIVTARTFIRNFVFHQPIEAIFEVILVASLICGGYIIMTEGTTLVRLFAFAVNAAAIVGYPLVLVLDEMKIRNKKVATELGNLKAQAHRNALIARIESEAAENERIFNTLVH